jgi:hypothetical protein
MPTTKTKKQKQPPLFEFQFQGKPYVIHAQYQCKPATIFTSDGHILHVRVWGLSAPYEPQPEKIEQFDTTLHSAAELATGVQGGLVAEFVVQQQQRAGEEGQPQ